MFTFTDDQLEAIAERLRKQPTPTLADAYAMGLCCERYGASVVNCHFSLFKTPELTAAWQRGKADAELERRELAARR